MANKLTSQIDPLPDATPPVAPLDMPLQVLERAAPRQARQDAPAQALPDPQN